VAPAVVGDTLVLTGYGSGITNTALFAYPLVPDAPRGVHLQLTNREFFGTPAEPPVLVGDDLVMPVYEQLLKIGPDGSTTVLSETPDVTQTGAAVADGIVVARNNELVQGRRLADGELLWEAPGGPPEIGAVPATDGQTVFYGYVDVGLVAADLQTGEVRWATPVVGQKSTTTPLPLPDGDVVYGGGGLARYDGATGEELWRDPEAVLFAPAAHAGGVVYAVGLSETENSGALIAVDAATGDRLWSTPVADPAPFLGPAVGAGVVVSFDGQVAHAHDAHSGEELWSFTMSRAPIGAPFVADGKVFLAEGGNGRDVQDDEYRISVHDVRTGRLLASWHPVGTPLSTRPIVTGAPGGRLLVPDLGLTVVEAVE
jgi:outer membrane protein assembly factor BamB